MPFIKHTYLYHFTRLDHRHNFSVYNTVLHLNSAYPSQASDLRVESLAFIPQLLLAVVAIPLICAKKDLAGTMLAQTFAFVTFNKVCTSQVRASAVLIHSCADTDICSTSYGIWSSCHFTSRTHPS